MSNNRLRHRHTYVNIYIYMCIYIYTYTHKYYKTDKKSQKTWHSCHNVLEALVASAVDQALETRLILATSTRRNGGNNQWRCRCWKWYLFFLKGPYIYICIYIEMILIHLLAGVNLILRDFTIHFGLETVGVVEVWERPWLVPGGWGGWEECNWWGKPGLT